MPIRKVYECDICRSNLDSDKARRIKWQPCERRFTFEPIGDSSASEQLLCLACIKTIKEAKI